MKKHMINEQEISNKFKGKYQHLFPIFLKLKYELLKIDQHVKIILKTIYIIIEFSNGNYGVLYWESDSLKLLLPVELENDRLLDASDSNWKSLNKMLVFTATEDVDGFAISILNMVSSNKNTPKS